MHIKIALFIIFCNADFTWQFCIFFTYKNDAAKLMFCNEFLILFMIKGLPLGAPFGINVHVG